MILFYLFVIVVLAVWYVRRKQNYWKSLGVPQNPQSLLNIMGDMTGAGTKYHFLDLMDQSYRKFKGRFQFFGMYSIIFPTAVVTDLDMLRSIMVKDFNNFTDRGLYHSEEADPLTEHLFNLDGEKWKRFRNLLSPTFTSGKMKSMFFIIEEKTQSYLKYLEKNSQGDQGVSLKDANTRFTGDVVSSTAFGLETKLMENENQKFLDILTTLFDSQKPLDMLLQLFATSFPKLGGKLKIRQFSQEAEKLITDTIQNTIDYRESNGIKRSDFLNMLINLYRRGTIQDKGDEKFDERLTFKEILAQAFIFLAAGYETTSTGMSFTMHYLSRDHEIQDKLRAEIREVKAKHGGKMDYEALMEMKYLDQVFNESMRIFPPVSILIRKATSDYKVVNSARIIPKGTLVQVPVYSIHRDPEYYPNPEKFDPDRFSPEEVAKRHPYAFIPFGDGPRNCIGMRFAQLQAKYALAAVVDSFKLVTDPRVKEPLRLDVTKGLVAVEGGLWVKFQKL